MINKPIKQNKDYNIFRAQTKNLRFFILEVLTNLFDCVSVIVEQHIKYCSNQLRQKAQSPAFMNRSDDITKKVVCRLTICRKAVFYFQKTVEPTSCQKTDVGFFRKELMIKNLSIKKE